MKTAVVYIALIILGAMLQKIISILSERVCIFRVYAGANDEEALGEAAEMVMRKLPAILSYIKAVSIGLGVDESAMIGGLGDLLKDIVEERRTENEAAADNKN